MTDISGTISDFTLRKVCVLQVIKFDQDWISYPELLSTDEIK